MQFQQNFPLHSPNRNRRKKSKNLCGTTEDPGQPKKFLEKNKQTKNAPLNSGKIPCADFKREEVDMLFTHPHTLWHIVYTYHI